MVASKDLKVASFFCIALSAVTVNALPENAHAAVNPIVAENQRPGDDGWQNDRIGFTFSEDKDGEIAGYASLTSVDIGDTIDFKVSVNDTTHKYDMDFYRLGWYGGKGGRRVLTVKNLPGVKQPRCPKDATTGLIECNWGNSYTLQVPSSWTTGIYTAMLTRDDGYFRRIVFVVRNDRRIGQLVYQQPVLTYQAYNCWPCENGGKSLYESNSSPEFTITNTPRAARVSLDRPMHDQYGNGTGDPVHSPDNQGWEMYLVQWLEREGYDISYTSDVDTHANRGSYLYRGRGVIFPGHSEYWTGAMYDAAISARNRGTDLGFFGANAIYWQVRLDPSSTRVPHRIITCYKDASIDPIKSSALKTVRWRDAGRPEQTLIGVQFTSNSANESDPHFPAFNVQNANSWVYAGTGFTNSTKVPGLVGYEIDRLFSEYPKPQSLFYTRLGRSPFVDEAGNADFSEASIYLATSGAHVFASGTMSWSFGLTRPGQINTGIQKTTRNILNAFVKW